MGDSGAFLCRAIEESNIELSAHRNYGKGEKPNQFNVANDGKTIKVFWTLQTLVITHRKLNSFENDFVSKFRFW